MSRVADTKSSLAAAATLCRSACRGARIEFVAAAARQLDLDDQQISARIRHVLAGRAVIEQAKGLLAYRHRINLADVYDQLQHLATTPETP